MTLSSIRASVQTILNRGDCTSAQADAFVNSGLRRITTKNRLLTMEREYLYVNSAISTVFPYPTDLLQPIDLLGPAVLSSPQPYLGDYYSEVSADGLLAMKKRDFRNLQAIPLGSPMTAYAIYKGNVYVRGQIPAATSLTLRYYGRYTPLVGDASTNEISEIDPDLVVYSALTFSTDVFVIPSDRATAWETRYQSILEDSQQQTWDLANEGGPAVISPTHEA